MWASSDHTEHLTKWSRKHFVSQLWWNSPMGHFLFNRHEWNDSRLRSIQYVWMKCESIDRLEFYLFVMGGYILCKKAWMESKPNNTCSLDLNGMLADWMACASPCDYSDNDGMRHEVRLWLPCHWWDSNQILLLTGERIHPGFKTWRSARVFSCRPRTYIVIPQSQNRGSTCDPRKSTEVLHFCENFICPELTIIWDRSKSLE